MLTCYDIRLLLPHGNDIKRNLSSKRAFVNSCFPVTVKTVKTAKSAKSVRRTVDAGRGIVLQYTGKASLVWRDRGTG